MSQSIPEDASRKQYGRCKQFLPLSAYGIDRSTKDGRRHACKACREKPKTVLPPIPEGYKKCTKCEQTLPLDCFYSNKSSKGNKDG